jgi:hypothetical protein
MSNRTIRVYDDRFAKLQTVAIHHNVPEQWTLADVFTRFGIAKHLRVYEDVDGRTRTIQPYEEWPR